MLHVVTSDEAFHMIADHLPAPLPAEEVPLEEAPGRRVSADIFAPEDLPAFARSTVDGYAVAAEDTYGCSESIPAMLLCDGEIAMGEVPSAPLEKGHCVRIATGGNLPKGADAVSMIEYTDTIGDELRYIYKPVSCLENVNNKGDDVCKGSIVLKKGTLIRARHIAILAALGISRVPVCRQIRIGILSTGDELVDYFDKPEAGQIRNINSVMLASQVREISAIPIVYPIVKDDLSLLTGALKKALAECDMVLVSGGSSVGEKDNTYRALSSLGEVLFHGISIKPGKPTIFALAEGKPVFGLPGHPQAAFFIFRLFASPAACRMAGADAIEVTREYRLFCNIPSNHGREEIVPVVLEGEYAKPLHSKSGVVSVLTACDGFIRISRDAEGLKKGSPVTVFLL